MELITEVNVYNLEEALTSAGLPFSKGQPPETRLIALANSKERSHAKFLRQIMLSLTVKASGYWWKEFDAYKIGVVRMSTSTMHTLLNTELTLDNFEIPKLKDEIFTRDLKQSLQSVLNNIKYLKDIYQYSDNTELLLAIKSILPESFLYQSHITLNYEVLRTIYRDRINHRVPEWRAFLKLFENIPFFNEFIVS